MRLCIEMVDQAFGATPPGISFVTNAFHRSRSSTPAAVTSYALWWQQTHRTLMRYAAFMQNTIESQSVATIRDAHQWLRWMTNRTLTAARTLDQSELHRAFPIGIGSVFETMVHLCGAEFIWVRVVTNRADGITMPTTAQCPDLDSVERLWKETRLEWDAFLHALTPEACERIVQRTRDGRTYSQRVSDACMQVPTHALYHNAQISFMFRSMGKSLPDSSWIAWAREHCCSPMR
ncbi:MAG: hypothetical protein FJ285_07000 [Planctomycetes bacterium]|nr:hypothetical protein [Planctomycetota bacterium]